jgi:hypothetical protein
MDKTMAWHQHIAKTVSPPDQGLALAMMPPYRTADLFDYKHRGGLTAR